MIKYKELDYKSVLRLGLIILFDAIFSARISKIKLVNQKINAIIYNVTVYEPLPNTLPEHFHLI